MAFTAVVGIGGYILVRIRCRFPHWFAVGERPPTLLVEAAPRSIESPEPAKPIDAGKLNEPVEVSHPLELTATDTPTKLTARPDRNAQSSMASLDEDVLYKYKLLLTKHERGRKFAIRSIAPREPLSWPLILFIFWAEGTAFLFTMAATNPWGGLIACAILSVFLYFRSQHGTVVEVNFEKRWLWIFKEYGGYGGGIWPPTVRLDIQYDADSRLFVGTVELQGEPIAVDRNSRRSRIEQRFAPLMLFLNSIASLPRGRSWRAGWLY